MAVIMTAEVAGADAGFIDGMRAAGVLDAIVRAPGFVSHISGAASSGYRVTEVWQTREDHQAWYDNHIAPNLPPGVDPVPFEYVEMLLALPES